MKTPRRLALLTGAALPFFLVLQGPGSRAVAGVSASTTAVSQPEAQASAVTARHNRSDITAAAPRIEVLDGLKTAQATSGESEPELPPELPLPQDEPQSSSEQEPQAESAPQPEPPQPEPPRPEPAPEPEPQPEPNLQSAPQPEPPVQPEPSAQQSEPQPKAEPASPAAESAPTEESREVPAEQPTSPAAETVPTRKQTAPEAAQTPPPPPQTEPDTSRRAQPEAPAGAAPAPEKPVADVPAAEEAQTPADAQPTPIEESAPSRARRMPPPAGEAMPEGGSARGRQAPTNAEETPAELLPPEQRESSRQVQTLQPGQEESPVESQLEAQGDSEAVENVRSLREKLRRALARESGTNDGRGADRRAGGETERNQRGADNQSRGDRDDRRADDSDRRGGERRDRDRRPDEGDVVVDFGLGFVVELGDQLVIRRDNAYETERFLDRARDVDVQRLRSGNTRTVVTRRDGTQINTVRNRYGDIVTRTRVEPNGRSTILIDNRDFYRDGRWPRYSRFDDLPPLRVDIPRDQYIVETSRYDRDGIRTALLAPPVEAVERPYALEEIRTSQRLRDKLRRVDLNTITFDFGSAAISRSQFDALSEVGWAMENILARAPNEVFLLEGHTDAVGAPADNLILSDLRAEAIAVALSSNFAIPPENLVTQGYGEQYLKVPTAQPEQENRRVTVRRITPLVNQAGLTAP